MKKLTDFAIGLIVGFAVAVVIMSLVLALVISHYKNKERVEYVERLQAVDSLREDYRSRDSLEFLESPDVRRRADEAIGEFERKRDELLNKFRSGIVD